MTSTLKQACFQGYPESAVCVQIPIGSRSSAIHNAYHTSLRPSSLFEPRHPSLKVVCKVWPKPLRNYTTMTLCVSHGSAAGRLRCAKRKHSRAEPARQRRPDAAARGALGRADDGSGRSLPPPRCPAENCKRHTILKQEFHIGKFT